MVSPSFHYDVIIIGAGSVGVPAAMSIADLGYKTLVLDPAPSVGQGSNKHAIGGIRATHSDPTKIALCLRSIEVFSTWRQKYGDDIEWTRGGYVFVAYRPQEEKTLKDLLAIQKPFGLNIDWLDKNQLLALLPDLNPDGLLGGTYSAEDGNASPLQAIQAMMRQAKRCGAEFRFNEPVIHIDQHGGRVTGVRTPQGNYGADCVINAAGAWAANIGQLADLNLPIRPDSHEAAITEPVAPFFKPLVVDIRTLNGSANFYFYQHITGQVMFCVTPSPAAWGYDTRETSGFLPLAAQRMIQVMPRLKNIRVRRTWRGLYPMTPDGFPIVGWSREVGGLISAVGMCGQGFMLGPGIGELLGRMVASRPAPDDDQILQALSPYRDFHGQEMLK
ncbi:MAG TPA: FAD-binding oxidoreductase [Anaerolinea sp.]|nr:FAD-binding oxidoreductase [Anaerolinea sp.]